MFVFMCWCAALMGFVMFVFVCLYIVCVCICHDAVEFLLLLLLVVLLLWLLVSPLVLMVLSIIDARALCVLLLCAGVCMAKYNRLRTEVVPVQDLT